MQRLQPVDNFQHPVHQCLPSSIVQFTQRPPAAQVRFVVRITTRAFQRTLPRDFNGKGGEFPLEDFSPGLENLRCLHCCWLFSERNQLRGLWMRKFSKPGEKSSRGNSPPF